MKFSMFAEAFAPVTHFRELFYCIACASPCQQLFSYFFKFFSRRLSRYAGFISAALPAAPHTQQLVHISKSNRLCQPLF